MEVPGYKRGQNLVLQLELYNSVGILTRIESSSLLAVLVLLYQQEKKIVKITLSLKQVLRTFNKCKDEVSKKILFLNTVVLMINCRNLKCC